MGRVDGKVALITGAGRGQGRSHAMTLAREGARVALTDICEPIAELLPYETSGEADLRESVEEAERVGGQAIGIKADARRSDEMRSVAEQVISEFGAIDIVSVNHGVSAPYAWDEQTDDVWDTVIETNLSASWRTAKAIIPQMIKQGSGSIIFTAATAGQRAFAHSSAFSASKAGVIGLMKALSAELGPSSIRVNAILPNNCATPMLQSQSAIDGLVGHRGATMEEMERATESMLLLPIPWVEPQDISNAVLFLGSDEARYVTGISLPVDGGSHDQPPGVPPAAAQRVAEFEHLAGSAS